MRRHFFYPFDPLGGKLGPKFFKTIVFRLIKSKGCTKNMRQICILVHVQNFGGGVASRVPWGWRDSYGKTEILAGWVTKICLKCKKKAGVEREGDI